jgi:hypothetical protein
MIFRYDLVSLLTMESSMFWKYLVTLTTSLVIVYFVSTKNYFNSSTIQRNPTSHDNGFNQSFSQQDLAQLVSMIVNVSDVRQVEPTLLKIKSHLSSQKMKEQSEVDRSLVEFCQLMLDHKGLIYRLLPIIEANDVTSLAITGALKSFKQNISLETPWLNHFFDYLFIEVKDAPKFNTISEVQSHFIKNVAPTAKSIIRLVDNVLAIPGNLDGLAVLQSIDFSQVAGDKFAHIPNSLKIVNITNAHLLLVKSHLQSFLGAGHYLSSYHMNDILSITENLVKSISRKTLLSQIGKRHPIEKSNLVSRADFFNIVSQGKYKNFLTLKTEIDAKKRLVESRGFFIQSLETEIKLNEILQGSSTGVLNSNGLFSKQLSAVRAKKKSALNRELSFIASNEAQTVIHPMSGEIIKINAHLIWSPEQKDLKNHFPVGFSSKKTISNGDIKMVDLNYGKPIKWNDATLGNVLPAANDQNLRPITEGVILNPVSSWVGAWLLAFQ